MARNEWWKQFPIGTRVRFVRAYGDYPISPVSAGETGTVAELIGSNPEREDTYLAVTLDKPHDDLTEWDNQIHIWVWETKYLGDSADDSPIAKDNDVPVTLNLDALARWFEEWCKRNNLPLMSADELLAEIQAEALSVPDSVFDDLISFLHQWEYAEQYA